MTGPTHDEKILRITARLESVKAEIKTAEAALSVVTAQRDAEVSAAQNKVNALRDRKKAILEELDEATNPAPEPDEASDTSGDESASAEANTSGS